MSRHTKNWYRENKAHRNAVSKIWRDNNKEYMREYSKQWRKDNPDKVAEYDHRYYMENVDRAKEYDKRRRQENYDIFLERERTSNRKRAKAHSITNKEWQRNNPHLIRMYAANRRAAILQRSPPWLTEEHYAQIEDMYQQAFLMKNLSGEDWHVDHIVPIRGKKVSGLHVPWNLQILPAKVNLQKTNKHEP